MLDEMIAEPGRYLLCSPRTSLIDEQAVYLRGSAAALDRAIEVIPIHSAQKGQRGDVLRRLREIVRESAAISGDDHRIVVVTHEALLTLDPSTIAGWHVRIDETPNIIASGSMRIGATWSSVERHYTLSLIDGTGWARVVDRDDVARLDPRQIVEDDATTLNAFRKAASNPNRTTFVDLREWSDAERSRSPVRWWSMWSFTTLEACASVKMTAASFSDSIAYRSIHKFDAERVEVVEVNVAAGTPRAQPNVLIHYFTQCLGSTAWWEGDEGSHCLVQISRHLERIGFDGFWAANEAAVPYFRHRFNGTRCQPKQAGTNSLIHHTASMAIYSNKAQNSDAASIEVLGLDNEAIRSAREDEDVFQFVLRGAIRDPSYGGTYRVYLHDWHQAEALSRRLRASGITNDIEIVPVNEAGILDVQRPASKHDGDIGSKMCPEALGDRVARKKARERARGARRRNAAREEKLTAGTYQRRGRPRKDEHQREGAPGT
ncbi:MULTISPECIES: hypothetical protein [unclassified Methylobacterium]|uniref:hypothetical protein n=1 Tax=unclassified Methylobacterium TaxID=2615210 RepID=UPI0036F8F0F4